MTTHLLRIRLSELTTLRLICGRCQTVIELTLDRLVIAPPGGFSCPSCQHALHGSTGDLHANALQELAQAMQAVQQHLASIVEVELTLPAENA